MSDLKQPASAWIDGLHRELVRSKHVILHGNTSDLALYSGMAESGRARVAERDPQDICMQFGDALVRYLRDGGFQLIVRFNSADGPDLADELMRSAFTEALAAAQSEDEGFEDQLKSQENLPRSVEMIRRLLKQQRVMCAVIIDSMDKLVRDPQHNEQQEVRILLNLKHALSEAAFAADQTGLRNTLIGVAAQLAAVPGVLYLENPRVTPLEARRPLARERRELIKARMSDFPGAAELSADRREQLVRELGDRTEGMTLFDIALLPRISDAEQIDIESSQDLIRAARYGKKEDPWRELDPKRLRQAEALLSKRVKGQNHAVSQLASALCLANAGITIDAERPRGGPPKGIFFFVGPTGVGKTELAKTMAEYIFMDEDRLKVFDMAEYQLEQAGERLAGAPPGFVGFEQGGQLTNHVLAEPFSVILFDEFEKAHEGINTKFLAILEEGRLTDNRGISVSFDQAMLVFTSNLGASDLLERLQRGGEEHPPEYAEVKEIFTRAVANHFEQKLRKPELLGRYGDNIIVFDMLRPPLIEDLCRKFLEGIRRSCLRQRQIELHVDEPSVIEHLKRLMRSPQNLKLGGRRVRELTRVEVLRPLGEYIVREDVQPNSRLHLSISAKTSGIEIRRQG